jgi:hypothetical protein
MVRDDVRERLRSAGPDGYVFPDYGGYCFHRVVPTMLDLLGGDVADDRTLPDDVLPEVAATVDRVLLLFVDGFGEHLWRRHDDDALVTAFEERGRVTPLTSIYPSETAAAVTSHHTGLTAAEHGAVGWDQWVASVNAVVQTLPFTAGDDAADAVGAVPGDLFDGEPLYPDAGVDATLVQPSSSADSTYTRRAAAGMDRRAYGTLDDLAREAVAALEGGDGPRFVDAYLPHVDAVGHASGTESEAFHDEVDRVSAAVRGLLDDLDESTAERTLVVVTADHGLIDTDPETNVDLRDLDGVWEHLRERPPAGQRQASGTGQRDAVGTGPGDRMPPVGSGRNVNLFLEPGTVERVRAALEPQVDCRTFTREEALEEGLFGPDPGERIRERCGDLVVVPREKTVWYDPEHLAFVSAHGGLSPAEMLVPFAVGRASDLRGR